MLVKIALAFLAAVTFTDAQQYHLPPQFRTQPSDFTWNDWNAMDDYVHRDDGWFFWRIISTLRYDDFNVTLYNVNMTSQMWMDPSFTTRSIWWHVMAVAIPDDIKHPDAGVFAVTGGSNHNAAIGGQFDPFNLIAVAFAQASGCVAGYMRQVPNQSMVFRDDPTSRSRSEDRIIAWTWRHFIDNPTMTPEIILRMPMTKSGKRGLDAMQQITRFYRPETNLQRFAVTGGSKRGWTAWSLAATDQRVKALFPLVFSLLQVGDTAMNHFRALDGAWSWALRDYWDEGITADAFNPRLNFGVFEYEDMIRYRQRFEGIPKVMVAATGDEFFSLTDSHPWWDRMTEPKYIMMVPNAQHTLAPWYIRIFNTAVGVWLSELEGHALPKFTWKRWETGVTPNRVGHVMAIFEENYLPKEVRAWYGSTDVRSGGRRDFRMLVAENAPCGSGTENGGCSATTHVQVWRQEAPVMHNATHYEYTRTEEGGLLNHFYTGIFIEAEYEAPNGWPLRFTTEVQMIPDHYPGEACTQDPGCHTHLV